MKRLLGLLLVMGMVGCGGGDEAPPAGEATLPATPNEPQVKVDELPVQTVDASPASEAALPATPKNEPHAKVAEPPVQTVDASKLVRRDGLRYEGDSETPFTGVEVEKHESGQKLSETTYKDGKREGPFNAWHENGQKAYEGMWKDGEEVSSTYWNKEGNEIISK